MTKRNDELDEIRRRAGLSEDKWDGVPMWQVAHYTDSAYRPFLMDGPLPAVLKEVENILQNQSLTKLVITPVSDDSNE